jgi:hypothetical protein
MVIRAEKRAVGDWRGRSRADGTWWVVGHAAPSSQRAMAGQKPGVVDTWKRRSTADARRGCCGSGVGGNERTRPEWRFEHRAGRIPERRPHPISGQRRLWMEWSMVGCRKRCWYNWGPECRHSRRRGEGLWGSRSGHVVEGMVESRHHPNSDTGRAASNRRMGLPASVWRRRFVTAIPSSWGRRLITAPATSI